MKHLVKLTAMAAVALSVAMTSCDDDDDDNNTVVATTNEVLVSSNITTSTTWETGKVYILGGRIAVTNNATLTIQPGVIVKGQAGTGANATALLIARGAKINAVGSATSPIIFTSVADEIEPGQIASPNLDPDLNGLWGGLIVLGNAPISADAQAVQIEGIPASDPNGLYGGTNEEDNSGVIKYVSIRHGGANIGEGNEINGLTLGGVGRGTTIENVEVVANQDDGIEWFGGNVSVTNAVVWNAGDDAIDTDQSWGGTLDNFIVINAGDECFELDGPEGSMEDEHTLTNGSVYADNADGLVDNDDNSRFTMTNVFFYGIQDGQDFDEMPVTAEGGFVSLSSLEAVIPTGFLPSYFFKEGSDDAVTEVTLGSQTVGANVSAFASWSWADASGKINEIGL